MPCDINVCAVCNPLIDEKNRSVFMTNLTPFPYNQGWGKTDNIHTADILQEAEVHILHLLMSFSFYNLTRNCFFNEKNHMLPAGQSYFPPSIVTK